jgi:hypothetical protein
MLYIFISEADYAWMLNFLTKIHPQAGIQYLHNMLEDDTLDQKIGSAFGQIYLNHNAVCLASLFDVLHYNSSFLSLIVICVFFFYGIKNKHIE